MTPDNQQANAQSYQPKLHSLIALLAVAGMGDSIFLWIKHLTGEDVTCIASSGCSEVLSSPYSMVGSIPLGAIGALGYFLAFTFAVLTAFGYSWARCFLRIQVAGMFAITVYLFCVQAFILHAFCDFCLLSAALTTTITTLVVISYFLGRKHSQAAATTTR
jgi:uncharacterized membrane protein